MLPPLVTFWELLGIAVALAMDVFTVSLGVGTSGHARTPRPALRLAFHFGLFQALMTLAGWGAGYGLARFVSGIDHWIALGLLTLVGVRMIRNGPRPDARDHSVDPTRGGTLVLLSTATSVDAFAVGLGLAFLRAGVIGAAGIIGAVSLVLGLAGLGLGNRLEERFGHRMGVLGGLLLIAIGLRIVVTHLSG